MNNSVNNNPDFITLIIPWFKRPVYINRVIDSIHEHADFPVEIIVHDDGSNKETVFDLCQQRDRISTLILNSGYQFGLGESINRAVSLASSKYIMFMNSDCVISRKCFKDIVNVLKKPYVGVVSTGHDIPTAKIPDYIETNGTKFTLMDGINGGSNFAFRKDVWKDIGGFEADVTCGCADTPFLYKMWQYGYFRSALIGDKCVINVSQVEQANKDSTTSGDNKELAYPKLFGPVNYDGICLERKAKCYEWFAKVQNQEASIGNLPYWCDYSRGIIKKMGIISSINWNNAVKHGQDKWKNAIENENIIKSNDYKPN